MRRITAFIFAATVLTAPLLLGACGNDGRSGNTATTESATETSIGPNDPRSAPDMRDRRYCEVLLVSLASGTPIATVYNSYPLNDCPAGSWTGLDTTAIAKQFGANLAVLNGPRRWTINHVEKVGSATSEKADFGGIEMYKQATVPIGSLIEQSKPYAPYPVSRSTIFYFSAGAKVFELTSPTGDVYIMQSFSQQKDPSLTIDALPTLASRLSLPTGWSYRSRTLDAELALSTVTRPAQVLQDDLGNSYSLIPTSPE